VSATIARNHARQAPSTFRNALDEAVKLVNAALDKHKKVLIEQGWHMIDTSNDTVEESVARILALLETSSG
jgi:regulator of PEP synthase PpsR (kinase-PPPase family)